MIERGAPRPAGVYTHFSRALHQGLGRAILYARNHDVKSLRHCGDDRDERQATGA